MSCDEATPIEGTSLDSKTLRGSNPDIHVSPPPDRPASSPYMDPATGRPIPIPHTSRPVQNEGSEAKGSSRKTVLKTTDGHLSPEGLDCGIARMESRLPTEQEMCKKL